MNFENWRKLAETVGLMALVGSLIFVGLQMRQDHQIALAQLSQSRAELLASRWIAGIESEAYLANFAHQYASGGWEIGDLSEQEVAAAELDAHIWWTYLNALFEQRRHGLVDDEEWTSYDGDVLMIGTLPAYQAVYQRWWILNPTAFTNSVDRILRRSARLE
jgi:hypothetical protein